MEHQAYYFSLIGTIADQQIQSRLLVTVSL
jgi:hypothetical protein